MTTTMSEYVTLGRSGLRVSPLCLGTMTFGTEWGWGNEEEAALAVFNRYIEAGGNFLDTADGYTAGTSETMLGKFIQDRRLRDRVVIATKFTFNTDKGNPNGGGNGRKHIYQALEGSLRRLRTDYVDLYWLHCWDTVTPIEEVISTLSDLVHAGKIRYYGFSDTPAWYLARAYTLAEKEGRDCIIALQLEYSLVERSIEREHVPAAQEFGLGICPWSPLASGFLAGKYTREGAGVSGEGRLIKAASSGNPVFEKFTDRNWRILEVLLDVARQMDKSPAEVALNWVATQQITSTIIGATSISQLDANLSCISFEIPVDLRSRLDEAGTAEKAHPYLFFGETMQAMLRGGVGLRAWTPAGVYGRPVTTTVSAQAKVPEHEVLTHGVGLAGTTSPGVVKKTESLAAAAK